MNSYTKNKTASYEQRRETFKHTFKNAAEVLGDYAKSELFQNFPDDNDSIELRQQFFMAMALNETPSARALQTQILNLLTPTQQTTRNTTVITSDYIHEQFINRLERL